MVYAETVSCLHKNVCVVCPHLTTATAITTTNATDITTTTATTTTSSTGNDNNK